jgi:SAM-dependent methyltransferase
MERLPLPFFNGSFTMRKFAIFAVFVAVAVSLPAAAQNDEKKLKIDVPFIPTDEKVVAAMLKMADVKEGDVVYDLGCGDGRIVISAVKDFKAKRGVGIDIDPERLKDCEKRMKDEKLTDGQIKKLTFKQGDVLKLKPEDFKDVDVVTLYLFPSVNQKLKPILLKGLKPGARVVSHDFSMGDDWKADKKEELNAPDRTHPHAIYLWTIKEK